MMASAGPSGFRSLWSLNLAAARKDYMRHVTNQATFEPSSKKCSALEVIEWQSERLVINAMLLLQN